MAIRLNGKGVSEGTAMAPLRLFLRELPALPSAPAQDVAQELRAFDEALCTAKEELRGLYACALEKAGRQDAEIFEAHLTILEDEYSVCAPIQAMISGEKLTAAVAIDRQFDEMAALFQSLGDELMAQRASDAQDLKRLLLRHLLGIGQADLSELDEDVIVLAEELTPSDTIRMDAAHVKGIATTLGGTTSHSAIIARTLGIPAVVGIAGWQTLGLDGKRAIIDGGGGKLIVAPEQADIDRFEAQRSAHAAREALLGAYRQKASQTKDGIPLELCANIGAPEEAEAALACGADGVGLFRSEFLYMDRDVLPTEEEQFAAYRQALEAMQGKPVIVRTLDAGGDKRIPALGLPQEENPFLGFRAIRMTLLRPEVFRPQLRALLRASVFGDLRVMFPMISSLQELREAKRLLAQERDALEREGVATAPMQIGMMIEIPAAAVMADEFAREVDFFSIGTNDLTQYTLAVERGNEAVASLYQPSHPAVLRLIAAAAEAARRRGIPCGMCGEAAGDEALAPAFVGMGVQELSMSPRKIAALRKQLGELTMEECRAAAQKLLGGTDNYA